MAIFALALLATLFDPSTQDQSPTLPGGGIVESVAFSAAGDLVAVVQPADVVRLFDFPSLKPRGEISYKEGFASMAFSPDGTHLAMNGWLVKERGGVRVWDIHSVPPKLAKVLFPAPADGVDERGAVVSIAFSPDGSRIIAATGHPRLRQWDWRKNVKPEKDQPLGQLFPDWAGVFSPRTVFGSSKKGELQFAALHGLQPRLEKTLTMPWNDAGLPIFSFTPDLKAACVWNHREQVIEVHGLSETRSKVIERIEVFKKLKKPNDWREIHDVAITADGSVVIASFHGPGESDVGVAFYPRTAKQVKAFGLEEGTQSHLILRFSGRLINRGGPPKMVFSPDGRWLVFCGTNLFGPRFWEVRRLGELLQAENHIEKR